MEKHFHNRRMELNFNLSCRIYNVGEFPDLIFVARMPVHFFFNFSVPILKSVLQKMYETHSLVKGE